MAKALTVKGIEGIKAGSHRREIPDSLLPGLYLVVQPSGAKSWAIRYRHQGKPRKFTLGPLAPKLDGPEPEPVVGRPLTLKGARTLAREQLQTIACGTDPAILKTQGERREPDTVRKVGEQFIEKWHRPRNRTTDQVARMFELHVYPEIGDRDIKAITRRDILDLLDKAEERGARVRANRIFANVRKLFGWATERGIIEASPVANIKAPAPEKARDRVLTDSELLAFLRACNYVGGTFGPLFRLLLLTAQRRDEVGAAPWSEFNLDIATWSLPGERTKNGRAHDVPLATQAMVILWNLPSKGKSDLLFPAEFVRIKREGEKTSERPVSGFGRAKQRLDARMLQERSLIAWENGEDPEKVSLPEWRLHDLRRTAASGMAGLGVDIHVVEKLLNHVSGTFGGIVGVYQLHKFADEKRAAAQAWANYLDTLVNPPADNVVPFTPAVEGQDGLAVGI